MTDIYVNNIYFPPGSPTPVAATAELVMTRLQTAVNSASYGDVIHLEQDYVYAPADRPTYGYGTYGFTWPYIARGTLSLPVPQGSIANGYVTIQTDPPHGTTPFPTLSPSTPWLGRINASHGQYMVKIESPTGVTSVAVTTQDDANYWKFQNIEIRPHAVVGSSLDQLNFIVRLDVGQDYQGQGASTLGQRPSVGHTTIQAPAITGFGTQQWCFINSSTGSTIRVNDMVLMEPGGTNQELVKVTNFAANQFYGTFQKSHPVGSSVAFPGHTSSATISSGTGVTIDTFLGHGLKVGQVIAFDYDGANPEFVTVLSVPDTTHFTATLAHSHGAYTRYDSFHLPHHFMFEQCYVHGYPDDSSMIVHGILAHCAYFAFNHGLIDEIKYVQAESHGIMNWNSPGPFQMINSTIFATAENFFFGGAGTTWTAQASGAAMAVVPGAAIDSSLGYGIYIRYSEMNKHLKWNPGDASWVQRGDHNIYTVKNLGEFKSAVNFLVDSNAWRHCWAPSLSGASRGQDGGGFLCNLSNLSSGVEQVKNGTFSNNWTDKIGCMLNVAYPVETAGSELLQNIVFDNNLYTNVGWSESAPQVDSNNNVTEYSQVKGGILVDQCDHIQITHTTARLDPSAIGQTFFVEWNGGPSSPSLTSPLLATYFTLASNLGFTGPYPFELPGAIDRYDDGSGHGAKFSLTNLLMQGNVLWDSDGANHQLSSYIWGEAGSPYTTNMEVSTESAIGYVGDQNTLSNNALASTSPYYSSSSFPSGFSTYDNNPPGCDVSKLNHVPSFSE